MPKIELTGLLTVKSVISLTILGIQDFPEVRRIYLRLLFNPRFFKVRTCLACLQVATPLHSSSTVLIFFCRPDLLSGFTLGFPSKLFSLFCQPGPFDLSQNVHLRRLYYEFLHVRWILLVLRLCSASIHALDFSSLSCYF